MKFIVREGFVVHDRKVVEIGGKQQVQESSFYEGQEVDFDEATAAQHAHKLEPVCKKADAFLTAKHPAPATVAQAAAAIDYALLAQAIVAAQALSAANQDPAA